jgi:hypothetical protein
LAFSYWIDNLGFVTEGKLVAIFIKPSLGVSNWPVILHHQHRATNKFSGAVAGELKKKKLLHQLHFPTSTSRQQNAKHVFWHRCRGKRRLLQGEFRTHILYFVLSFAFTLLCFYLHHFIKNTKKLFSFIVAFIYLLLVLLV